jgi:hypothetical protein
MKKKIVIKLYLAEKILIYECIYIKKKNNKS